MQRRPGGWTEAGDATLRELWAKGLATAAIAAKMSITKGAVIGRAHRLKLPARPSPIHRTGERPPRPPRVPGLNIGPVRRQQGSGMLMGATLPGLRPTLVSVTAVGTVRACAWPMWNHRERSGGVNARFCCEATIAGKSYCHVHHALAYEPKRAPREIADAA